MDNIRGKTIAITGAARGIGYATAKALLERGARVVIGDREVALQESAVAKLTNLGQVSGYPLDVTDRESFAAFLDKARTDGGGRIDVLINNAGVMPIGPFLDQSEQTIRSTIEVNFYGVLTGCQLVLPEMVARRSGHIVNIASLAGMLAVPGQVVYAGTKFAVVGLSSGLSDEFSPQGVEVSCVMPTFTNTELVAGTHTSAAQKPVEPEDIAAAVVRVLDKPKTLASVPPWGRFFGAITPMLSAKTRRWMSHKMGNDTVFLTFDRQARQSYEQRAQDAQGVVEGPDKP
ncbi:MAG: SDR family oxidoreductase [Mycobacteriaceae bacterium]|nr:SDR family oxidoreductase [Mycobacteriaceae bacterium]